MPSCKYCNLPLTWKKPYSKGDRPVEVSGKPHNCPKFKGGEKKESTFVKYKKTTKYDYERCPYCKGINGGYCMKGTNEMENHIKTQHPNGEIKYDDDFSMMLKKKEHRPCIYCGKFNLYDYVLLQSDNKPTQFFCKECSHR